MSLRLGDIELVSLQTVEVDEARNLVEHRLPGHQGSMFQDLGRGAVGLTLEGVLLGEEALRQIETLRAAHAEATPLRFSADIAVGTELTDVVVEDVQVDQVPGHRFRYQFRLRIREWIEPPEPPGAAVAAVDDAVAADAAAWNEEAVAVGGALDDPGALAELVDADPTVLATLDDAELAGAFAGSLDSVAPDDLASLTASLAAADPGRFEGMLAQLGAAKNIGDVLAVLREGGAQVFALLKQIDPSVLTALGRAFIGGPELLDKLGAVKTAAEELSAEVQAFDPLIRLRALEESAAPQPSPEAEG